MDRCQPVPSAVDAIIDIIDCMASITIRNLDPEVKERLRVRAASNGRSMEAEARQLLESVLPPVRPRNLAQAFIELGESFGGIDLDLPSRELTTEHQRDPFEDWTDQGPDST
jgi:plasmid stability protein